MPDSAQQVEYEEQDLAQQHEDNLPGEEPDAQAEGEQEDAGDVPQPSVGNEVEETPDNAEAFDDTAGEAYEDDATVPRAEEFEDADADADGEADAEGDVDADAEADGLHRSEEAEEYDDYVEYAEYNEDEDERYEEDLSQDFGGDADTSNDPHTNFGEAAELGELDDSKIEHAEGLEGV